MKRRSGTGSASDDDLIVKPPEAGVVLPPPVKNPNRLTEQAAKELHERALNDVKQSRLHRNDTLRAAAFAVIKSAAPKILFFGGVFGYLMYDGVQHQGSIRGYVEEVLSVFGMMFSLLFWAWNRH